jgi:hypothetical protein
MQWQIRGLLTELCFNLVSAVFKTNSQIEIGLDSADAEVMVYTIRSVHRITHSRLFETRLLRDLVKLR